MGSESSVYAGDRGIAGFSSASQELATRASGLQFEPGKNFAISSLIFPAEEPAEEINNDPCSGRDSAVPSTSCSPPRRAVVQQLRCPAQQMRNDALRYRPVIFCPDEWISPIPWEGISMPRLRRAFTPGMTPASGICVFPPGRRSASPCNRDGKIPHRWKGPLCARCVALDLCDTSDQRKFLDAEASAGIALPRCVDPSFRAVPTGCRSDQTLLQARSRTSSSATASRTLRLQVGDSW